MFVRLTRTWLWSTLAMIVGLALPSGCQKDSPTNPADSPGLRIGSVEVESSTVAAGDTTEVRAQVVTGSGTGTPVPGATVTFGELSALSSGAFSKTEDASDAQGWASVSYVPTNATAGQVTLKIKAGSDIEYVTLQVGTGGSAGSALAFSTNTGATSLAADGVATLSITIAATSGVARTPVPNLRIVLAAGDQFVDLNADGIWSGTDQLSPSGDRNTNHLWDAEGTLPETVTTDANGRATFLYRSGSNVGDLWIKATGGGVSSDYKLYQHPLTLQVSLASATRELLADGVSLASIEARVVDWGNSAIAGVVVKFVAGEPFTDVDKDGYYTARVDSYEDKNHNGQWDAIGSISSTATTDQTGTVTVWYTAGLTAGDVTLRATTSNGSAESSLRLINVPPAGSLVFVEDNPIELYADGVSTVDLSISARDVNGLSLAGKKVLLAAGERFRDANYDGVFTAGTDVLLDDQDHNGQWTAMGSVPSSVSTDADGVIQFAYHAGTNSGTVWIHATADQTQGETSIALRPLPQTLSMDVNAASTQLKVFASGGADNTTVSATCRDAVGNAVPAGVPVAFSIAAGPGGGEKLEGASAGVVNAVTNGDGIATAVVISGTKPGAIQVRATSGTTVRNTTVYVGAGPAAKLTAHAAQPQIDYWSSTTIEAAVQDAYGNAVEDGTVIRFSCDEGVVIGEAGTGFSETEGGIATASYQSLGPAANTDYIARITATAENSVATGSVSVQLGQGQSVSISSFDLTSDRSEVNVQGVGGVEEALIRAQGKDASGQAVGAGFTVSFTIASGPNAGERLNSSGWGPVTATTDAEGFAQVRLRSGTESGPVEVRASATGATSRSVFLAIASGETSSLECYADSVGLAENSSCTVHAYLYDNAHHPVPDGTVVYFTVDEGVISGTEAQGSALSLNGQARATYQATLSSDDSDGIAVVSCRTANDISCETEIAIPRGPSAVTRLTLDSELGEIGVAGTGAAEQVTIRARGYDSYNRAVRSGVDVTFTIEDAPDGGEHFLNATTTATVKTDASGQAAVILQSGTKSGTVVVSAAAGSGTSNHTSVAIAAGPPHYLYLGHEACNVKGCSETNVENKIVALVSDIYRNPVRDNTVIYWTVDKGVIEGGDGLGSSNTVRGACNATWRSGDSCGLVTITSSTLGGTLVATNSFWSSDVPASVEYVTPSSSPVSIAADGNSTFPILVDVRDWNDIFVLSTNVEFETLYGKVEDQQDTEDGCSASLARGRYKSATLDRDNSYTVPDDGIGGIDQVTATVGFGGGSDVISVELLTSAAYKDNCELNADSSVPAGGSFVFNCKVADRYGNPLGGHVFAITVSGGTVTNSGTSDMWGVADGLVYQAPVTPGTYNLTVVDVDPSYSGGLVLSQTITVQ